MKFNFVTLVKQLRPCISDDFYENLLGFELLRDFDFF